MGLLKSAVQQCAFKRPAANTGGSSKRPKQADKKEQRLSTKAPGPNTLGGLFSWPYKVLGRLRMSPLWNTFARNMAAGLVVHSDHSGSGNGEEGLRDIIEPRPARLHGRRGRRWFTVLQTLARRPRLPSHQCPLPGTCSTVWSRRCRSQ